MFFDACEADRFDLDGKRTFGGGTFCVPLLEAMVPEHQVVFALYRPVNLMYSLVVVLDIQCQSFALRSHHHRLGKLVLLHALSCLFHYALYVLETFLATRKGHQLGRHCVRDRIFGRRRYNLYWSFSASLKLKFSLGSAQEIVSRISTITFLTIVEGDLLWRVKCSGILTLGLSWSSPFLEIFEGTFPLTKFLLFPKMATSLEMSWGGLGEVLLANLIQYFFGQIALLFFIKIGANLERAVFCVCGATVIFSHFEGL